MEKFKGTRFRVKAGWEDSGREGVVLSEPIFCGQTWIVVRFLDEDEPDLYKIAALEEVHYYEVERKTRSQRN